MGEGVLGLSLGETRASPPPSSPPSRGVRGAHDELRGARRREGHRLGRDGLAGERDLRAPETFITERRAAHCAWIIAAIMLALLDGERVDGCGNSRGAMGRALNEITPAGASKPSGRFFSHLIRYGRAQRFSRAQSAGLFSKKARKWPISPRNAENTDFSVSAAGCRRKPKLASSSFVRPNRVTTGIDASDASSWPLATASGGTSRRDAVGAAAVAACARGVVPGRHARRLVSCEAPRVAPGRGGGTWKSDRETRARRRASRRPVFRSGDRGRGPRAPLARAGGARAARNKTTGT